MLFSLFYEFFLWLLALAFIPKILFQMLFLKKYRSSLLKRLGKGFPKINKQNRKLIWLHAPSLGETRALIPLAKVIKKDLPDSILLISSITETGHEEAKKSLSFADYHVYLPFDFSWIMKPIIQKTAPDLLILCESDFWYHFLKYSKDQGARLCLINGKISQKSSGRWKKFPSLSKKLFRLFDLMCIQGKTYQKRFEEIGAPSEKLIVTGNLKFDDSSQSMTSEELTLWRNKLGIGPQDQVIVIGSSHDPEERLLLNIMDMLWIKHPHLKVILVPRHPERFDAVAALLSQMNLPFLRFTKSNSKINSEKIILMDAMGQLNKCYQIATIAIVGGSYTSKVGGHNIIEPSWHGVPVIFGPYMYSQPDLVELAREYETGLQVPLSELVEVLDRLLNDSTVKEFYLKAALRLIQNCRGATERTWREIQKKI